MTKKLRGWFIRQIARGEKAIRPDSTELFKAQGRAGINFKDYSKIKVERSGPAHSLKAAPALGGFEELVERLPDVLRENLKLMRYTEPTPIQAHAVPLAMNGYQSHYLTAD